MKWKWAILYSVPMYSFHAPFPTFFLTWNISMCNSPLMCDGNAACVVIRYNSVEPEGYSGSACKRLPTLNVPHHDPGGGGGGNLSILPLRRSTWSVPLLLIEQELFSLVFLIISLEGFMWTESSSYSLIKIILFVTYCVVKCSLLILRSEKGHFQPGYHQDRHTTISEHSPFYFCFEHLCPMKNVWLEIFLTFE